MRKDFARKAGPKVADPTMCHYFSSNTACFLVYAFFTVGDPQSEWLQCLMNQIEFTGLDKNFIFRIFLSCLNRIGPALKYTIPLPSKKNHAIGQTSLWKLILIL